LIVSSGAMLSNHDLLQKSIRARALPQQNFVSQQATIKRPVGTD
jgi:hypothetical protein